MMNLKLFAESTLTLLQQDPSRYRNFGVYWYLVKAVLKRFYTQHNLMLLGDNVDRAVTDRMPEFESIDDAIQAAIEEYNENATYNLGRSTVNDPVGGGTFTLIDSDAGGL